MFLMTRDQCERNFEQRVEFVSIEAKSRNDVSSFKEASLVGG